MDLALNNLQWLICHKIEPSTLSYRQREFFDGPFVVGDITDYQEHWW